MKHLNRTIAAALAWGCVCIAPAAASGLYCANVEVPLESGPVLRVTCEGALYLDRVSVLQADARIELRSTGSMTLWGTLVAPEIVLVSDADLSFGGGVFSGNPQAFPDVTATSWAETPSAQVRVFSDLVPRPIIDPVFGAVTVRHDVDLPVINLTVTETFLFIPDEISTPVPEPSHLALFGAGLGLIAWKRRAARALSRTAHAPRNPKVTLEK